MLLCKIEIVILMKKTLDFLNNHLKSNEKIVIGLSGGSDSICLCHLVNSLKEKYNLEIIAVHINHGLRKESLDEKVFVEDFCKQNKIIFEYFEINNYKNDKFSECEAREKRYKIFKDVLMKYKASILMTAHHGDDLIETILMRIVRGSNLNGYAGIPVIQENENYRIMRPLLFATKEEIKNYIKNNNLMYVEDASNESDKYTRNRFRKQALPFLKKEARDVHSKFLKYSEELYKYENYINKVIGMKIDNIYDGKKINLSNLLKEDEFIQEKIIQYVIRNIQKDYIFDISDVHIRDIMKLIHQNKNSSINLCNDFIARVSYDYLYIEKNTIKNEYKYEFQDKLVIDAYNFAKVDNTPLKDNSVIRLNSKDIKLPLFIRSKKDGDKIKVKNLGGTKKVKEIFIDSKVDIQKRSGYPILVDSNDTILWIPNIKKSIFDKDITENCDIIIKCMEENNE